MRRQKLTQPLPASVPAAARHPAARARRPPCEAGRSVVVVRQLKIPRGARRPVNVLYIAEAPDDLRPRVGLPVRACGGHFGSGQGLRNAVSTAGILRVIGPAAFPLPQVLKAPEL